LSEKYQIVRNNSQREGKNRWKMIFRPKLGEEQAVYSSCLHSNGWGWRGIQLHSKVGLCERSCTLFPATAILIGGGAFSLESKGEGRAKCLKYQKIKKRVVNLNISLMKK